MSLSQTYRLQIATKQNRWLVFYVALAATVHGVGVISLAVWHPKPLLNPQSSKKQNPTPVEFVYVKPQFQAAPPPQTERRAQANSVASDNRNPALSIQPGKAQVKSAPPPAQAAAPTIVPRPQVSTSTLMNPAGTTLNRSPALPPRQPSLKPRPTFASPVQTDASPAVTPRASLRPSSPAAPPSSLSFSTAQLGSLAARSIDPEGQGLSGTLNSNRDGSGFGVDAVQDNQWGSYLSVLNQAVNRQWQRVSVAATRRTRIQFRLDRQGQLTNLRLLQSSGDILADQAALQAIRAAAPFAPLPQNVPEDVLIVNFTFTQALPSNDPTLPASQ